MVRVLVMVVALAVLPGCLTAGAYKSTSSPTIATAMDTMTGVTWVKPELGDRPGAGFYLYYAVRDGQRRPMRAVFEVWNEGWIFTTRILVKADADLFTIDTSAPSDWHREVVPGMYLGSGVSTPTFCAERIDFSIEEKRPDVLQAMCTAQTITVRFVGDRYQKTLDDTNPVFAQAVRAVCAAYAAAGPRPQAL